MKYTSVPSWLNNRTKRASDNSLRSSLILFEPASCCWTLARDSRNYPSRNTNKLLDSRFHVEEASYSCSRRCWCRCRCRSHTSEVAVLAETVVVWSPSWPLCICWDSSWSPERNREAETRIWAVQICYHLQTLNHLGKFTFSSKRKREEECGSVSECRLAWQRQIYRFR